MSVPSIKECMVKNLGVLPFVIGVTGHRDLRPEDLNSLKEAVGEILDGFQKCLPHTPVVVLSALAEGGDRLVAEAALTKSIKVIAPLPMAQHIYEKDFDTTSLEEFRSLIARIGADNKFELPLVAGSTEQEISETGKKRDLQYAQAGQYIALHSHMVLALWDGADPNLIGGTADVVKMCLSEGRMEELASGSSWLNYEDERGPVYQVLAVRSHTTFEQSSIPDLGQLLAGRNIVADKRLICPNGKESAFKAVLRSMERFNKDCFLRKSSIERERIATLKMFEATDSCELKRWTCLANVFVAADQLALQKKHVWEKIVLIFHILVGFAFCIFVAIGDFKPLFGLTPLSWTIGMWGIFIGLVVLVFGVWGVVLLSQIQNRFLDYRGLAEALRIQFNWHVAGIHDVEVADCYLRNQADKLGWIRKAIRVCCIGRVDALPHHAGDRLRNVFDNWVKEQSKYYTQATPKREVKAHNIFRWSLVLLLSAFGCAVLMLHNAIGFLSLGHISDLIKMLTHTLFGLAAVIVGYAEILAIKDESKQFERMRTIYNRADNLRERVLPADKTGSTLDLTNARKIIYELGKEALAESGDWIVMHREHPLSSPIKKEEIIILKKSIRSALPIINTSSTVQDS